MNNLMRKYGAATIYGSEIALSCYGLMMKIYQIAHAMFVGLASGTQPINGFNFGARQYERVKQTIQTAAKISIGISVLWFLVFRYGGGFLAALLWRRNRSIRNLRCIASACICWASLSMDCQM